LTSSRHTNSSAARHLLLVLLVWRWPALLLLLCQLLLQLHRRCLLLQAQLHAGRLVRLLLSLLL
jgi:hypothetical protein